MEWDFTFLMSCVLMFFQQPIMTDTGGLSLSYFPAGPQPPPYYPPAPPC